MKPFFSRWPLLIMSSCYAIIWLWAAWSPMDRFIWFLENLLIFLFWIVFILLHRYFHFSYFSYFCIMLFLTLHTIGGHYSYQTPIDPWLKQWFSLDRSYFDRIVHFSFGLLIVIPIREWYQQMISISSKMASFLSILTIFAAGSFYELIEMWVAMIVAPEASTAFLGLQGDPWDTQHDMELALYGSMLMILFTSIKKRLTLLLNR